MDGLALLVDRATSQFVTTDEFRSRKSRARRLAQQQPARIYRTYEIQRRSEGS